MRILKYNKNIVLVTMLIMKNSKACLSLSKSQFGAIEVDYDELSNIFNQLLPKTNSILSVLVAIFHGRL
jgi:hypothetical protein